MSDPRPLHRLFGLSWIDFFRGASITASTSRETSSLWYELFTVYSEEPNMPDKLQEFVRETIDKLLKSLPPEERLKGLPPEELRKRLPPEERLKGLSVDEVIKALPPDVLEALTRRLKTNGPGPKSS